MPDNTVGRWLCQR